MKKSTLRSKKGLWIAILSFLLLIVFIFFNLNYKARMLSDNNKENLQILADEKASQVNAFLESQEEKLDIIASMDVFIGVAKDPHNPEKIILARDIINQLNDKIPGIGVLTKEGIVVVSSDPNATGADYSFMPQFPVNDSSQIQFTRYYDLQRKKDYYAIGGPIYDTTNKSKVIGVITFDIELNEISRLMNQSLDAENSEVYLIDGSGLLLSNSKYIGENNKHGILIQDVKSDGAERCLDDLSKYGENASLVDHGDYPFEYINYMGNKVYGAHSYVPAIGGCVLAEENIDGISKYSVSSYVINIFKKEVK